MGFVVRTSAIHLTTDGKALHLFDENGQALTDSLGFALLDLSGVMLLQVDAKQKPFETISGRKIYDAKRSSISDPDFDPTLEPIRTESEPISLGNEKCLAFDGNGQPLTDLLGVPLCFSSGLPMVLKEGGQWRDSVGQPATLIKKQFYDKCSLTGFTNSQGDPILLFNQQGVPLTDVNGTPQNHASGKILIHFNVEMDPTSDWLGNALYDACGHTLGDPRFRPCGRITLPDNNMYKETGVQYFNKCGYPLTNRFGVPLLNPEQKPMLNFDHFGRPLKDINGDPVFDVCGLPVGGDLDLAICGPNGAALRLYNSEGRPITSCKGFILRSISGKPFISVESSGRLKSECKDGKMYDRNSKSSDSFVFNAEIIFAERQDKLLSRDGRPLQLYDQTGYPLTDPEGVILFDNKGKSLIKCSPTEPITTADGKKVFDVSGHPCMRDTDGATRDKIAIYDKYGRPLTDQYGKILRNRKGHKLVKRKYGEPIDTVYGGGLYDSNHVILDDPDAEPHFSLARESNLVGGGSQLFDCNDLPVTDHLGDMLYSSSGIALLEMDESGRPKSDYIGRPVFDERGLPVTKSSGCWKDQKSRPLRLYNYVGHPLTDYQGCPLRSFDGEDMLQVDDMGRPLFDSEYRFVKDSKGRNMLNENFKPILNDRPPPPIADTDGSPLKIFNSKGWPLTDDQGRPLVNAKGKLLLIFKNLGKISDCCGKPVYDRFGRPFACNAQKPMMRMNSEPLILYDMTGHPLTASDGTPLNRNSLCLLRFDKFGRPSTTSSGENIFDALGHQLFHSEST